MDATLPDKSGIDFDWLYEHLNRTIRSRVSVQVIYSISDLDFRAFLPQIDVPAFVLHASRDQTVPLANGRALAEAIPGSSFLEVPSKSHVFTQAELHWRETLRSKMDFREREDNPRDPASVDGYPALWGPAVASKA